MIDKPFNPQEVEPRLYKNWEESGAFKSQGKSGSKPFAIMMPPPNVTGSLHMGHALSYTLQDILVRFHRMKGDDVLWQPGTDHAGIATQMVVERNLAKDGIKRKDLGREAFLKKVWQWKEESGNTIVNQQRRLGLSCDWSRHRFTLDEGLSEAVTKVFIDLYKAGLIYKDKRLVNWDPKLQTAVSDLEVKNVSIKGSLWHIKYPLADDPASFITIATSRPETMFADVAVAVHPEDERYQHLIGKNVVLPFMNRLIPIIADTYSDPEKGTGAVKITPGHDFNDFEVGKRHKLEMINILDAHAHLTSDLPEPFGGMDRFEARKKVVAALEEMRLLEKEEAVLRAVPHGEKTDVVLEPMMTDQWFLNTQGMADEALKAVHDGTTQIVPENWKNTYDHWLENIQPWCISRQLWWGHRIPAWYGPDGKIFVDSDMEKAQEEANAFYGKTVELTQDPDVLDTWFSSALWPFSTLGWPEKTADLERFYPTSVMVTGTDILFFWVARMMMMGLYFMKKVPFETVVLHALVRDQSGQKMSKTKGNVVDPLEMIETYGADALRYAMASLASPGRDIKFSPHVVEHYRNFGTKLWNAGRYCAMNGVKIPESFDATKIQNPINQWILKEAEIVLSKLEQAYGNYRFDEIASLIYAFAWGSFCDWYIECSKPLLSDGDAQTKKEVQDTLGYMMGVICHMLHPMMPFLSEELFGQLSHKPVALITASWPEVKVGASYDDSHEAIEWIIHLITAIRGMRAELNIPASAKIPLEIKDVDSSKTQALKTYEGLLSRLARLEKVQWTAEGSSVGKAQLIVTGGVFMVPLAGLIDLEAEKLRITKALDKAISEITVLEKKLGNEQFVENADPEIVDGIRQRHMEETEKHERLTQAIKSLG